MNETSKYSPELWERAVRLVLEQQEKRDSQLVSLGAVAAKVGRTAEALRTWMKRAETRDGKDGALTVSEHVRLNGLERETFELKCANDILRKASALFAQAERDRPRRRWCGSSMSTAVPTESSLPALSCRFLRRYTTSQGRSRRTPRDCLSECCGMSGPEREIRLVHAHHFAAYGVRKVWRQVKSEGSDIARCTVGRLMNGLGTQGTQRARFCQTMIADAVAERPQDRLNRPITADRRDQLWLAEFT